MKPLLILLTFIGFIFAQNEDDSKKESNDEPIVGRTIKNLQGIIPIPGVFELTEEMINKIDKARAIHKALMEAIKVMSPEEKIAYFEELRLEARAKMEARLEELSPELKTRIEAKMADIQSNYEKKKVKIEEFRTKINTKSETVINKPEIKATIEEFKAKWKAKEE